MTLSAEPLASSYAALDVAPGTPAPAVKEAYRRLVRAYHPDAGGAASAERFVTVRSAYETISRASTPGAAWRSARALESYGPLLARPKRLIDVVA